MANMESDHTHEQKRKCFILFYIYMLPSKWITLFYILEKPHTDWRQSSQNICENDYFFQFKALQGIDFSHSFMKWVKSWLFPAKWTVISIPDLIYLRKTFWWGTIFYGYKLDFFTYSIHSIIPNLQYLILLVFKGYKLLSISQKKAFVVWEIGSFEFPFVVNYYLLENYSLLPTAAKLKTLSVCEMCVAKCIISISFSIFFILKAASWSVKRATNLLPIEKFSSSRDLPLQLFFRKASKRLAIKIWPS